MEISTSYTFGCAIMDRNISLASSLTVVIMDKLLNWEFVKTIKWCSVKISCDKHCNNVRVHVLVTCLAVAIKDRKSLLVPSLWQNTG